MSCWSQYTRGGSLWFQVSGVEDDAENAAVEAYMYVLKKMTKDLPMHPMPVALRWDPPLIRFKAG